MSEQKKRRQKVSGHGSITKAGKVRQQTRKIPVTVKHKYTCPRLRNRRKYEKRIIMLRESGQH